MAETTPETIEVNLEKIFRSTPTGSIERAIVNNLRGINHQQTPSMLPSTKELQGYVFFTRPQLNMRKGNIRNVRNLGMLLSSMPNSIQQYIRNCLDPRLMYGIGSLPGEPCPIIDNLNPFIVPFTNNVLTLSGWPPITVPTRTSDPGLYNQSQTLADGRVIDDSTYTINMTLRNTSGDFALLLTYCWAMYMSMVFEGKLVPYMDFITENELDYNTRIYRFVMDHNRRKITKFFMCNAAVLKGIDIGAHGEIASDKTYMDANETVNLQFACDGFRVFDPLIIHDFNEVGKIFNPAMEDDVRDSYMVRVPPGLLKLFNFSGYPRVNMETSELEWYVDAAAFDAKAKEFNINLGEVNSELFEGD